MDGDAADFVAFFHHKYGFADFRRLYGGPPARRAAADDDQIITAQLLPPSGPLSRSCNSRAAPATLSKDRYGDLHAQKIIGSAGKTA